MRANVRVAAEPNFLGDGEVLRRDVAGLDLLPLTLEVLLDAREVGVAEEIPAQ